MDVPAGDLIPAGVVAPQTTGGMVKAELPAVRAEQLAAPHAVVLPYKAKRPVPARAILKIDRTRAVAAAR